MKCPYRKVVRVDRSPMNPMRWSLTLECGHEVWVTQKTRPTRMYVTCEADVPEAKADGGEG